jgi:hypothetical protein
MHLSLPAPRRWGGRRNGAGRKRGPNTGLPHTSRASFGTPLPAHVTLRVRTGVPSLRTVSIVRELERSFRVARARPGFRLVHYSLQGNHAHLIVEARDREALGRGMKSIAARVARAVNRISGHKGPVMSDRYHLRMLATPKEVRNALRYVLLNARHHVEAVKRTAEKALRMDPASSGRWFNGWKNRPADCREDEAAERPVATARTWLLAVGWRRHGLIDPADVPA